MVCTGVTFRGDGDVLGPDADLQRQLAEIAGFAADSERLEWVIFLKPSISTLMV